MYEDGQPGEIFITMSKEGSTISGLMDSFATAISMALQYGVPLRVLVDKFSHMRFEPSGFTKNPDIPMAKSIMDYIFRWLGDEVSRWRCAARSRYRKARARGNYRQGECASKKVVSITSHALARWRAGGEHQQRHESLSAGCAAMPRLRRDHDP